MVCLVSFGYKTRRHSAKLTLNGKYTILTGLSGTGKTLLASRLRQIAVALMRNTDYNGPSPIYVFENTMSGTSLRGAMNSTGALIVIDEESDFVCDDSFRKQIVESPNYFLFITRDGLEGIPYGVNDVFILEGELDNLRMVPAYHTVRSRSSMPVDDIVVCEGSGIDYAAIAKKLKSATVISAIGKNNVVDTVYARGAKLFLVDWCGTGFATKRLMSIVLSGMAKTVFSASFEAELLCSKWLGAQKRELLHDDYLKQATTSESEEAYYTSLVSTISKSRFGIAYNKSSDSAFAHLILNGKVLVNKQLVSGEPQPVKLDWLYPELEVVSAADSQSSSIKQMRLE